MRRTQVLYMGVRRPLVVAIPPGVAHGYRVLGTEPAALLLPRPSATIRPIPTRSASRSTTRASASTGGRRTGKQASHAAPVTGAAGFIGTNFVRQALARAATTVERLVVVDALTYAGNYANLADLAGDPRVPLRARSTSPTATAMAALVREERDRRRSSTSPPSRTSTASIEDATPFLRTNVHGTLALLEAVRARRRLPPLPPRVDRRGVRQRSPDGRATEDWPHRIRRARTPRARRRPTASCRPTRRRTACRPSSRGARTTTARISSRRS